MGVDTGRLRVVGASAVPAEPRSEPRRRGPKASRHAAAVKEPVKESSSDAAAESTEGFHSPGPYLKAQRRRRGMSLDQLAAETKIPRPQLELIEADRFEELPGMVFAKGFLRCIARTLELDPEMVLGLLYERERTALRKRRRETAPDDRPTSPASAPARASSRKRAAANPVQAWVAAWLTRIPSARIVMWLVVALIVALVVFIAFTLASSQAQTLMIRS